MRVNVDFSQWVVIRNDDYQWISSPAAGVERMILDRIGKETGHATSLVHYAANSTFPSHEHSGGEEILVLEGEFSDEHGSCPAGSWIRSPHMSRVLPYTKVDGALIYVKTGHLFKQGEAV